LRRLQRLMLNRQITSTGDIRDGMDDGWDRTLQYVAAKTEAMIGRSWPRAMERNFY